MFLISRMFFSDKKDVLYIITCFINDRILQQQPLLPYHTDGIVIKLLLCKTPGCRFESGCCLCLRETGETLRMSQHEKSPLWIQSPWIIVHLNSRFSLLVLYFTRTYTRTHARTHAHSHSFNAFPSCGSLLRIFRFIMSPIIINADGETSHVFGQICLMCIQT